MNIAIIAHSLYPIRQPYAGGLEMITHLLVNRLVDKGHRVTLYAHVDSRTSARLIPFPTFQSFQQLHIADYHKLLGQTREELYQTFIYQKALAHIQKQDYDIIHNHSLHAVPIIQGEFFGDKFITTFHTPIFPQLRYAMNILPKRPRQRFTVISRCQQKLWQQMVPVQHIVYNGIDLDYWRMDHTQKLTSQADYFFWMGRICPEKGTHYAIDACIAAGERLVIGGPASNKQYFDREIRPRLNHPLIDYRGHLHHHVIRRHLNQAKAYVFTSTWEEPYGLTLAESLASGCPVVAFAVGAAPEILDQRSGILVAKEDTKELTAALSAVAQLDRTACRRRAEAFCCSRKMVDAYEELYQTVNLPATCTDYA